MKGLAVIGHGGEQCFSTIIRLVGTKGSITLVRLRRVTLVYFYSLNRKCAALILDQRLTLFIGLLHQAIVEYSQSMRLIDPGDD